MGWKTYGAAAAATLAIGGGATIAADNQIDPYTDRGDKLEIAAQSVIEAAGENKVELAKDRPAVTLSKWDGEAAMTVSYEKVKGTGSRAFLTDRIEWKDGREEMHAYPLEAKDGMEDGGFEIEVVLNEKPDTNVFDFTIEGAESLRFAYQSSEYCSSEDVMCPKNVVGSYAVYHKTKANHQLGKTNYVTGKGYQIFRPKAVDANGWETWAELSYTNGTLSVTVSQKFLDEAAYPVKVDPTFGYTSFGSSSANIEGSIRGGDFTIQENGVGISMTLFLKDSASAGTQLIKANVYDISNAPHPNGETEERSIGDVSDAGSDPYTFNFNSAPSFTAGTTYKLGGWSNLAGGNKLIAADNLGGDGFIDSETYGAWPNPLVPTANAILVSVYVTYTSSCDPTIATCTSSFLITETWTAPTGVTSADVACWGGGGGADIVANSGGGGGGGGAFASSTVAVTPGNNYTVTVGVGGVAGTAPTAGTDSTFIGDDKTVNADGGTASTDEANGVGGTVAGSTGDVENDGGNGGDGLTTGDAGGGGGGAGGPNGDGAVGANASATVGGGGGGANGGGAGGQPTAGTAGTNAGAGGTGDSNDATAPGGGAGENGLYGGGGAGGGDDGDPGGNGGFPGGGGGGGEISIGGQGADGQCTITYTAAGGGGGDTSPTPAATFHDANVIVNDGTMTIQN